MQRLDDIKKKSVIDNAVEIGLAGKKSSGGWKRHSVVAAAVILIGIPMFGFAFPAIAAHIPRIFELFYVDGDNRAARLQDFAQEVRITGESNDMSIMIEEFVFDGQTVYFSYIVESENALRDGFSFLMRDVGLRVDGVEVYPDGGVSGSSGFLQRVYENTYIAVGSITFPGFHENLENAEVHFRLGSWHVAFPIERVESDILLVDETVGNEDFEVTVTQAMISPLGATVHFSYTISPYYSGLDWDFFVYSDETEGSEANIAFRIRDDLGTYVNWQGSFNCINDDCNGWIQLQEELHPDASELIITPYVNVHHWQLGDWEYSGGSIGAEDIIAGGGSVEHSEVILDEIVIRIP